MSGTNGPMGKEAIEIGAQSDALVAQVASAEDRPLLAAGLSDGRVWLADLPQSGQTMIKADKGAAISALALSSDAQRLAWGDEDGGAGIAKTNP